MSRSRIAVFAGAAIALVMGAIGLANYVLVHRHVQQVVADDPRNQGLQAYAHFDKFVLPSTMVFDLRAVDGSNSAADVFRFLLQFAKSQKDREYNKVVLAFQGQPRFVLDGAYFKKLGEEFGTQNPIYTMRTFPQNVYGIDGKPAFGTWTGGLLGVTAKQIQEFNDFHRLWYVESMVIGK